MSHLPPQRFWPLLLAALVVAVFWLRVSAPADLEAYAQARNIGYTLDLVHRGNWLAQYDIEGRILSKPPLHTWFIGIFAVPMGVTRLALVLPSAISVLALTLLVYAIGRRQFGPLAGGMAGVAVILSPMFSKHVGLVRSDALFTLCITAGAWAAWRAWQGEKRWVLFWTAGAFATLTKGPLGLLLSAAGLLAYFWEKRTDGAALRPRGSQWPGIAVFFGICLAWLVPALWVHGQTLVDKIFFDELFGQATGARKESFPGKNLPEPTLNLLSRFAPFSLLTFYGIWRAFRRPAADADERRFERFLICWILAGLLIFSLAAHHRADLLLPLWPAAALLAGREAARLAGRIGTKRFAVGTAAICLILLGLVYWTYHHGSGPRKKAIQYSEAIREAAAKVREAGIDPGEIEYIDSPTTFQMYLGTARPWLRPADVEARRAAGNPPRYLGTESKDFGQTGIDGVSAVEIFRWPPDPERTAVVRIFEPVW